MLPLQSLLGGLVIIGLAWGISERRRDVSWRAVVMALLLQLVLALLLLKLPPIRDGFAVLNGAVVALSNATRAGTAFVFGYLGGADAPFAAGGAGSTFVLGFQALPLILVISALSALLFHWNVIQPVVRGFSWLLRRTIGVNGPVGLSTAMNIFVGMVEAPLVVRPYLAAESRAGLFVIMTGGMASVAGTVMVLYATMLDGLIPNPLAQLLVASILAAPASILISFLMVPEDRTTKFLHQDDAGILTTRQPGDNMMSVITRGTLEGVQLIIAVIAMLIVLIALVSLVNSVMTVLPHVAGEPLTLQRLLGWALSPLAWLMGIPWSEAGVAGSLLGTKTVLNELIAYADLSKLDPAALSPRSRLIMTYALCGFANLGSLGIMIGGLTAMVPERRAEIVALAPKSLVSGTLATCLTAALVGLLTWS